MNLDFNPKFVDLAFVKVDLCVKKAKYYIYILFRI
jgi:hypothetical protein